MAIHRYEINKSTSDYLSPAGSRFNSENCIGVELIAV